MTLEEFFDEVESRSRSLVVLNRSAPDPIQAMLEETFFGQEVAVSEQKLPDAEEDTVVLVEGGGGESDVIASSPLQELQETILLVNSDLYRTGSRGIEDLRFPDVLARLDGV